MRLGRFESRVRGVPPGRQIYSLWVIAADQYLKPSVTVANSSPSTWQNMLALPGEEESESPPSTGAGHATEPIASDVHIAEMASGRRATSAAYGGRRRHYRTSRKSTIRFRLLLLQPASLGELR
jgi:hypothetical protein